MNDIKKGWVFVGILYLLSIIPYIFIVNSGESDSIWTVVLMWLPALAAVITRLLYREGLFSGMVWNPIKDYKWMFIALATPFLIELLSVFLTILFEGAHLKEDFILVEDGNVSIRGTALIFGAGPQYWPLFILNYLFSFSIGVFIYALFFGLGEEYGWRGYLQNKWIGKHRLKGLFAIGLVWGFWHLPAILMGHNYPDYPILGGLLIMPLMTILLSVAFGLSFLNKKVIWVAAMFHASLNISSDISNSAFVEESLNRPINDLIWSMLWLIASMLIYWHFKKSKQII